MTYILMFTLACSDGGSSDSDSVKTGVGGPAVPQLKQILYMLCFKWLGFHHCSRHEAVLSWVTRAHHVSQLKSRTEPTTARTALLFAQNGIYRRIAGTRY